MSNTATLDSRPQTGSGQDNSLDRLQNLIQRSGELLPVSGPITAFAFLNTLQALEDLPFDQGMQKGARLFGCQPYLSEDRYREKMARGRIGDEDLAAVLQDDLAERADALIGSLGTRFHLQLAMLRYPLQLGPTEELRWFVAETDALTRLRTEASLEVRKRIVEETRHWVMRDLRSGGNRSAGPKVGEVERRRQFAVGDLIQRFGETSIEDWSEQTWEAFTLQALWRICRNGVHGIESFAPARPPVLRHRDIVRQAASVDSDPLVHDVLIRFCAAFTDQGFAHWSLPHRDQGFFKSFCALYGRSAGPPNHWLRGLRSELDRLAAAGLGPLESIEESLRLLGVGEGECEEFIAATLLALRGWAGLIWQMEVRPDRVAFPVPPGSLIEFLAVRLILERLALAYVARWKLNYKGPLDGLRAAASARIANNGVLSDEQRAFAIFQLAQILDWSPPALSQLSKPAWTKLLAEVEGFTSLERRRLFHLAFERRYRTQALDAFSVHAKREHARVPSPSFQSAYCIDAREESFRRHLEEVDPQAETFGAAGFFSVPIYFRGVADAHFTAQCPIVVRPQHWVVEDVVYTLGDSHRRRAKTRRVLGAATHQVHVGSRSIAGGALLTAGVGVLASIPLVARVLFPRTTARIRRTVGRFVEAPLITRLRLERTSPTPGPGEGEIGFTVEEMANLGERVLRDIGLTSNFARLVMFLGHGSFCLNNPHKSAYDCGACTGSAGGPNARALAVMLNDVRVREILSQRGLPVPVDTRFLGGLHNTCSDTVTFYDLDLLPPSHVPDFESAQRKLDEACERNAHERCRRFASAPLNLSFAAARRHAEERSEDLAQTRPEFGNATNAICFVGRRERARGLYMDRRAFMHSYDPLQDDDRSTILARILAPVVPVCEGINMQYLLSYIDSPGWGCGTKLPHNVASLLGVMDGAASDLRPGLPWQGVEIHEPVRLLFIIETTPQAMLHIMTENELVGKILHNGWAQLAVLSPYSSEIQVYRNHEFQRYKPQTAELPFAPTSTDWYRGWRDHLGFAVIEERRAQS